jgi:dUTP pyrophosphatase
VRTGIIFAPWPHIYIPFLNWSFNPLGNIAYKIHTRSGLALKRGIRAHLGIIDTDYRNECNPILFNHNTSYPVRIRKGEKIAQVEFYRVTTPIFWKKDKLSNSARGDKGFGSSGK